MKINVKLFLTFLGLKNQRNHRVDISDFFSGLREVISDIFEKSEILSDFLTFSQKVRYNFTWVIFPLKKASK